MSATLTTTLTRTQRDTDPKPKQVSQMLMWLPVLLHSLEPEDKNTGIVHLEPPADNLPYVVIACTDMQSGRHIQVLHNAVVHYSSPMCTASAK